MPLIHRILEEKVEPSASVIRTSWRGYVPPAEVRATDEPVEPTPEELVDLRALYPEEYADDAPFSITEASAKEAIAAIEAAREDELQAWFTAERDGPARKSVLAAFVARGLAES